MGRRLRASQVAPDLPSRGLHGALWALVPGASVRNHVRLQCLDSLHTCARACTLMQMHTLIHTGTLV